MKPNRPSWLVHDSERVEEHDLDVEDDEDHRHQVEAHREAGRRLAAGGDAGLVRATLGRVEPDPARGCLEAMNEPMANSRARTTISKIGRYWSITALR